ncbi:hypothetical protein G7046_g5916 [Stylonectria norvegica]|nr:hypothetical protein G7046_g5916 [Stylonectria norvegica]
MIRKPKGSAVRGRLANRRLIFTFVVLAVCSAKGVHLYNHRAAIATKQLLIFFFSFFAQDIALLIVIRLLLDHWVLRFPNNLRHIFTAVTAFLISYNAILGVVAVSFYLVAGSEIHWRNAGVVTDATSRMILLSGLVSFILVISLTIFFSYLLQGVCYGLFGWGADIVNWPFNFAQGVLHRFVDPRVSYVQVLTPHNQYVTKGSHSVEDDDSSCDSCSYEADTPSKLHDTPSKLQYTVRALPYIILVILLSALSILVILRPKDASLTFLSWTTGLLPFVDFSTTSPSLVQLPSYFGTGIQRDWDTQSALAEPLHYSWLPKEKLCGFEDWHTERKHYSATADPMKICNLDEPLLHSLRSTLKDVPVRHVVIFFLESTRNDIFPIKKDGLIWNRLAETFPDSKLPKEAEERLATLTPVANYITGDYDDGFEHKESLKKKRGGPRFTNARTAGTYTLKSMVGTICGVAPLVGDFNVDYKHHIYQPCLPHIFEAFNKVDGTQESAGPYPGSKWKSYSYQTATLHYDNHDKLMSSMGYPEDNMIDREYLRSEAAKHGPVTVPDVNDFAFEEEPLEEYIRDIFVEAREENERVFLTHITSTSHHRFKMPAHERYVPLAKGLDMFSHYINAIGYDSRWVQKVLTLLDDEGVANETLIVFVGDHGVSMPENDIASPYYNPNVGVDHVPLILSHPKLPAFDVDDAVHSSQILPTILDILLETQSLNPTSRQVATDLIRNFEGQSLIRPLKVYNNQTGQGNWQYTIINPGGAVLSVRDARYPERHLVVPIIDNVEWRLSNLTVDPREVNSVQDFDFISFLRNVQAKHGSEVAKWVEEGAFMSRWWVEENTKRWRYGAYALDTDKGQTLVS